MKKIVIAGTSVYGIENLGDEALLKVLVDNLREEIPGVELTVIARHPGEYFSEYHGVRSIRNLEHESKDASVGRWFNGLNPGDSTEHLRAIAESIADADLFILGGDPFNELRMGFGSGLMPHATILITLAKFLQTPTAFYAVHMGRPIQTDIGKEMTQYCVGNVELITLREEFSREVLESMGVRTDHAVVLADPAFGLDPIEDRQVGLNIFEKEGIKTRSNRLVGINFRHQYWNWKQKDWDHYREIVVEACDFMIDELDVDLLFIPNSTYEIDAKYQLYQDDRPANRDIVADMKNRERAHQITSKYNLTETLSLFPHLDMHFSSRRHSLAFAAIHHVPVIAAGAGGQWHIGPAMDELNVPENFLDIETLTAQQLKERILYTWENREMIRSKLQAAVPPLSALAKRNATILAELATRNY